MHITASCTDLLHFSIGIQLPRLFRLLEADHGDLIDQSLVCPHTLGQAPLLTETILRLDGNLRNFAFLKKYIDTLTKKNI